MGEPEAIVGCATTNIASAKTIQALGGVWVWQELWEAHNEWDDYYRIDVDETLAKFAPAYERFVAERPVGEQLTAERFMAKQLIAERSMEEQPAAGQSTPEQAAADYLGGGK